MPENTPPKNPPKKKGSPHTVKNLRLDLEAALAGKTWKLLPEGFRAQECGKTYPMPSFRPELQKLITIPIPVHKGDGDCGIIYLGRAIKEWKRRESHRSSAAYDNGQRRQQIKQAQENFKKLTKELRQEVSYVTG